MVPVRYYVNNVMKFSNVPIDFTVQSLRGNNFFMFLFEENLDPTFQFCHNHNRTVNNRWIPNPRLRSTQPKFTG